MAAEQKFIPCHGNSVGAHPPIVFLRKKTATSGAVSTFCVLCGTRSFHNADFWKRYGYTRAQALAMCPQAIDGSGQPL